jgi:hypothetical protein
MTNDLVYGLNERVSEPGSLGIGSVQNEGKVRFVITNAGLANVVRIRARIVGQTGWVTLADLTGTVNVAVDVFTYDQIEVLVLVFDSNTDHILVVAQSFDGSVISINTPDGGIDDINTLNFISSDNSVLITSAPGTGTIDFVAVGGGGGIPDYVDTFNSTSDWTGPALDVYSIVVAFATHGKSSPTVDVFETSGAILDLVYASVSVDAAYNITLTVTSSPDLRFAGKLIIS